ncbi:MAG: neutral/alkaline non-lysosomal ceramidase N-terminal domain-containing protein [Kiritimatiellae bacterium]|nr:neutral/alkaline non-lysosomal ceramidase N-terminal domain-containing protein [Kiritimatiellia bacterium]
MDSCFQTGVARVDITPPAGHVIHCCDRISEGVGDPLFAKALSFGGGNTRAALLTADLIMLENNVVSDVRRRVAARTPIPAANIMFAASHTHAGPATTRYMSPRMSDKYIDELKEKLSSVVAEAWGSMRPARLGAGNGEAKLAVNRWVETPEGARWGVNPDGPTDNSVGVLRVDDADGKPFAAVVNFAAHPTVVSFEANRLYTGDYPSHLQATLESLYPGLTALFVNGASGDLKIAFIDDAGTQFRYGDLKDAQRYGTTLAHEAARVLSLTATRPISGARVASTRVDLPLQPPPTRQDLLGALEHPDLPPWGERWAKDMLAALSRGPLPDRVHAEAQVMRLGDAATLVALPGEAFVEIGLRLKRLFACGPMPFVIADANGYCGYLSSARSVRHDGANPRYNWHKIVGYPAGYSAEMEDVLVKAALSAGAAADGAAA